MPAKFFEKNKKTIDKGSCLLVSFFINVFLNIISPEKRKEWMYDKNRTH